MAGLVYMSEDEKKETEKLREAPEHLKMQKMCNEAVAGYSYALKYVPDHFKTQEMCIQALSNNP